MSKGTERRTQLLRDDTRYLWHPFTQMQEYRQESPVIIERAEGIHLIDIEGRRYMDGVSSLWVNVHGHRKREIDDAMRAQIERVSHTTLLGLSNVPAIELARQLVEITPAGLEKVFYSDSGSTAVEIALKMAFQYHQQKAGPETARTRFIALTHAYHGDTIGSVSVGGISLFHKTFEPLLFDCTFAPAPYCYRCPLESDDPGCGMACADALEEIVQGARNSAAAVIIEPLVQGAAGMLVAPEGYLARVRDICTRHGLLMIADEVATGFGRTGTLFACEQEGVRPDLLCLAKGITGGTVPLAATLATEAIYGAFLGAYEAFKTFFHGHTYTGNPVACAAALANLALFDPVEVLPGLSQRIRHLAELLAPVRDDPQVGDVRQKGFMVGIELVRDKATKEPYPPAERIGHRVILVARKRGLLIRPLGDVVVLMPPLCTEGDDLSRMVTITAQAIREVTG